MSFSGLNLESYQIPLDEIKCATENFSHERCIGGGGFGAVYKGQLRNRIVAVKRLGPDSYQGEREFRNEIEIISRFHHENIISFIGYCDEEKEMIIVYEYAMNGSLDQLQGPNKMSCITWTQRLKICIGAARGLNYLHSGLGERNKVIHRDVKSANILLDDNLVAKICDFGLSKLGPKDQQDTELYTKVAGTQFYLDPTYNESQILTKESDVYSFGVVLFEILSGMLVYHKRCIGDKQRLLMNIVRRYHEDDPDKVIDPGIGDEINCGSFDTFKEIAYKCISFNIKERPTLDTVIKKLEEALSIQMSEHVASTPAADHTMIGSLLHRLNSARRYDQWIASGEISRLTKTNPKNRAAFSKAGVIPLLTNLLTTTDSRTQENTTTAILSLSIDEDNKGIIMSSGAVPGIVHVLKEGSMVARENAAATLLSLSVIDENDVKIGSEGAVPPLVLLLSEGSERGKRMAVNALFNLCIYQGNKIRAVRAGVVPMLVELLTGVLKDKAMAILALLSSHHEGRLAIGRAEALPILLGVIGSRSRRALALPILLGVIGSRSRSNEENAVEVLVELCLEDDMYLVEAEELGELYVILDLLKHGTDRGKRKARQLQEKIADQQYRSTIPAQYKAQVKKRKDVLG